MKKISFVAVNKNIENSVPMPKPTKLYIPDWYKDSPSFFDYDSNNYVNKISFSSYGIASTTMKMCMPFLDTFSFGYIQETWCDIFIENKNNKITYHYSYNVDSQFPIMQERPLELLGKIPVPTGFKKDMFFNWSRVWSPILPKGYSAIITHPLNRDDLPFRCQSGIVDFDNYFSPGKVGFFLKEGFVGLIPKGTPMYQIIPFKRDSWKTENIKNKNKILNMLENQKNNVFSTFYGGYKKNYWNKKNFN
jgi:hypothetical protein